jgi:4-amino-4-deoxy-L-arabinose transferase-like glycosyltransferase
MSRFIFFAFLLRLGLGVFAYYALPLWGYDTPPQQAGYLFLDAYRRDTQARELALSSAPLAQALDEKFASDQYGGLLWLSALVYRYLHPHPLGMVTLAALVGAWGGWFVYQIGKRLGEEKIARFAALLHLFYPDSVLLGAAQMREPFLMTLLAMTFYAALVLFSASPARSAWFWLGLGLAGLFLLSPGFVALALLGAGGWAFWGGRKISWQVGAAGLGIFLLALLLLSLSWQNLVTMKGGGFLGVLGSWARETTKWNALTLKGSSGIVQVMFESLPRSLVLPFVTVYGILQPVLPAALIEPGIPLWQSLGILRALGWYALLPLLGFAPFALASHPQRRQWLWLAGITWGWVILASARGGGDQWDNPRYRIIALVWMALLAAQAFYALPHSPARRWLWRIVAVLAIIVLVFSHWYSWRYWGIGYNLGIRNTVGLALALSALLVGADWLRERTRPRV